MDHYIELAGAFIQANQEWAGLVLALLALGESLLVIGVIIPATALLMLVGGLIGSGTLSFVPMALWGIAGAIVGDAISYGIGRWLGPSLLRSRWLRGQRRAVARARLFFQHYGSLTIFLGRFLGPLRSVAPTVAGMMRMRFWRFQVANILSAIVWVPAMLTPGYLAARSIDAASGAGMNVSFLISAVVSVLIAVWVARALTRKRRSATRKPLR